MDKYHKWIEHHSNGPAKFYKCLRCKRFAFYLEYNQNNGYGDFPTYQDHQTLEQKFMATWVYINNHSFSYFMFRTNYFGEQDVKSLGDVLKWTCEELDIKDILT